MTTRFGIRSITAVVVFGLILTACSLWVLTAYAQGYAFFSHPKDIPAGAYWMVTNDHGSRARDLVLERWDGSKWTSLKSGATDVKANDSQLAFGVPVYAVSDGEVMTCWRNAPENPGVGGVLPERDGCSDDDKDGNMSDQYKQCSCRIPRAGNHLNVRLPDGRVILYAHLKSGSIPAAFCPNNGVYVANALDSNNKGPNGFLPEIWIPEGQRPKITKGQLIGRVGNNGASSGPHLHIHQASCDTHDCSSVPLLFGGITVSVGVDGTKDISGQKWKILSPSGSLSGPPQLIKIGQVISQCTDPKVLAISTLGNASPQRGRMFIE
jgi:hypothetical protein